MRKSKLWMVPCLVLPVLAGCGGTSSANEVVIKIWEDESNIETVKALANDFITSYKKVYHDAPDIVLEFTAKSEKVAIEEMGTVSESGEGPDIAAVTHDTIASGVDLKLVAPVAFSEEMKSRMTEEALNAVTYNETIYGYPITAESMTVMYDKTQISAAELVSFEALKASGKKIGLQLTGDNGGYYTYGLYTDSVLFGEDGKDPETVNIATSKSIENVTNFYSSYLDCFEDASPEVALNYVTANRIAGVITTPFLLNSMKEALGNKLAIAKLPTLGGEELRPFSGYKAYVVSRYSKNGAIAQALCEYLTNYDSQAVRLIDKGYLPASPLDATQDFIDAMDASEEAKVFADSLKLSTVMPNIPEMSRFWSPMNSASTNFIRENSSLTKETVQSVLKEVTNTILNK